MGPIARIILGGLSGAAIAPQDGNPFYLALSWARRAALSARLRVIRFGRAS